MVYLPDRPVDFIVCMSTFLVAESLNELANQDRGRCIDQNLLSPLLDRKGLGTQIKLDFHLEGIREGHSVYRVDTGALRTAILLLQLASAGVEFFKLLDWQRRRLFDQLVECGLWDDAAEKVIPTMGAD